MEINEELLNQIIPPITKPYNRDREWFSNDEILSSLNKEELRIVEQKLIEMLKTNDDILIPQTLVKMESINSIPVMLKKMEKIKNPLEKITWASFVNEIKKGDKEMEKIAFREFENFEFIYGIQGPIFHDLIKFESERINKLIESFVDHKYPLVSIHARKVLGYKNYSKPNKQDIPNKKWWEFWK